MYINLKGQNVYYQTIGEGKNLILLHGWKQDVSTWWEISEFLKKDFKLWLIDLPGFGRSDPPPNNFNVKNYADCVADFIRINKISKPILLGHSVGGNISLKLTILYPNLIDKLILEDSSGIRPNRGFKRNSIFFFAKLFHYLFPNIFNLKDKIRNKLYFKLEADYINAGNLKGTLINILNEDLTNELSQIKNATLLIWGENDQSVKLKYGKIMYKLIPNSQIEILENVGHFPHLENPKLFAHYVKDFGE